MVEAREAAAEEVMGMAVVETAAVVKVAVGKAVPKEAAVETVVDKVVVAAVKARAAQTTQ